MSILGQVDVQNGTAVAEEAQLLTRAQAGDMVAWEALMRRYETAVFRLAYLILHDPAEADDAAQEAFIRAYRYLDRVDGSQPLRPWLLRVTRNVAINRQRSLSRYWAMTRRFLQTATLVDDASHAEQLAQQNEAAQLRQAVQQLNAKGRDVIYLRYFLELSEAETAVILDIPKGTVKSRLSRALEKLRGVIERDFPALQDSFY